MRKKRKKAGQPGRPEFKPSLEQRNFVAMAAGSGRMSHEEIAIGLGISRNTLEKHFEHELAQGALSERLKVLRAMHDAALKGNVAAQKAYLSVDPTLAAPPAKPDEKPTEKIGKKDQAQLDARTAQHGTEWHELLPAQSQKSH